MVTGHNVSDRQLNWSGLVHSIDTLVILMGLSNLAAIMDRLLENGCEPERPVGLIRSGTRSQQVVVTGTVGTIAVLASQAKLRSPVTIVVGAVARLAAELDWFPHSCEPVSSIVSWHLA